MDSLNIVDLIESNPITKLTNTYNVKLLDKMKSGFTDFEQQLFIASFYCYLNYDKTKDFIIDMDNIWKWLGFGQKVKAEKLLEKNFVIDIDYKNLAFLPGKAVLDEDISITEESSISQNNKDLINKQVKQKKNGGQNLKKIMLNIKCFKLLCLNQRRIKTAQSGFILLVNDR
jgi:hypothetical protein